MDNPIFVLPQIFQETNSIQIAIKRMTHRGECHEVQHSKLPQTDDMASRINIKKNMNEKSGATSISATPSGYTTNARPGPAVIT